jgi:AraC-like DNA-binding protein
MLSRRAILDSDSVTVDDVACRHGRGVGDDMEESTVHMLVFVRRGCFVRTADGVESVLDATTAYCVSPGTEQRFDHPGSGGDDCTAIGLDPALAAALWGGDQQLPGGALSTTPEIDLEHRLLLAAARRGASPDELAERAIGLAANALERGDPRRVGSGRPSTARSRRVLVEGARELLAADPDRSLADLARTLAVSPHHLSRIFHAATGHTISRHRMRLRARAALERLAGGERDLARLAADVGAADQSHLCRIIRSETGQVPSALRRALAVSV